MKFSHSFTFPDWFGLVTKSSLKADLQAGLTGAVIVLPQGMAFAVIAGLPPEYGIYTAIVTQIVAALFGSSRHLVSGPTIAISLVVFSAVGAHAEPGTPEFISLVLTLTFLTGVYQLAFGLARLGVLTHFVSPTVIIGFTAGAAVLIITSQVKHITGIEVGKGETFFHTWIDLFHGLSATNVYLVLITLLTISVAIVSKRFFPKSPYLLIGMVAGSVFALLLKDFVPNLERVGEIPSHLPPLSMPDLSFAILTQLAPQALAVALLGLIEAVSISQSIAVRSGQKIDANQEFEGQGLSNVVGSFFSSFAGSGSFTRSGVNYEAGAQTPLASVFAAFFLALIVLVVAPLTAYLPIAAMSGVILLAAFHLIDFREIRKILRFNRSESAILLTTLFATLFLDLEFAVYLGVLLSLILFLAKTSMPEIVELSVGSRAHQSHKKFLDIRERPLQECPQLKIIRIDMSIYFGSIHHIQNYFFRVSEKEGVSHILIEACGVNFIDLAGEEMLVSENKRLGKQGGGLYFVNLKSAVYEMTAESYFFKEIGNGHFFDSKQDAVHAIYQKLNMDVCQRCPAKIFDECAKT